MSKDVIITGVAGFVGINLSQYLLAKGYHVLGVDIDDVHGRIEASMMQRDENFSFIRANLANQRPVRLESRNTVAIFHLAALPHVDYSKFHPRQVIENNISSLVKSIELSLEMDVPLIFSSSVECYGGTTDKLYTEEDLPSPLSPYAASKVAGEAIIKTYVETRGLRATTLRFTNLYGPWQAPDRLLPRITAQAMFGYHSSVEKGTQRDFVFVEDACALLEKVIQFDHVGSVFNLSTGQPTENSSVATLLAAQLPSMNLSIREPREHDGRGKYLTASPAKLYLRTSWRATTKLIDGIPATVKWYQDNQSWLRQFEDAIISDRSTEAFLTDAPYWNNYASKQLVR